MKNRPAILLGLAALLCASLCFAVVPSSSSSVSYAGNDSTTVFAVAFKFFQASDLVVTLKDDSTGVVTVQVLTTNYTVTGGADANGAGSGTVTMITAPATGQTLKIERTVPMTQVTSFRKQTSFSPAVHENAFDRLTMQNQQLDRKVTELADAGVYVSTSIAYVQTLVVQDGGTIQWGDGTSQGSAPDRSHPFVSGDMNWQTATATCDIGGGISHWAQVIPTGSPSWYTSPADATALVSRPGGGQVCVNPISATSSGYAFANYSGAFLFATRAAVAVRFHSPTANSMVGKVVWFGLQENCGSSCGCFNVDTTIGGSNAFGFRYSAAAGDSTWKGCNLGGGVQSCCDTGVTVAANTMYVLEARTNGVNAVSYYVNGALKCTNAANVPTVTTAGYACLSLRNVISGTAKLNIDAAAHSFSY